MNRHEKALELDKVLALLAAKTSSESSRQLALSLEPYTDYRDVSASMQRTADMNSLTNRYGTPSLGGMSDWRDSIRRARIGSRLSIPELIGINRMLKTIRTLKEWRTQHDGKSSVDYLFEDLLPNRALEEDLDTAILSEDELSDRASGELAEIRRKIRRAQSSIREQLDRIIHSPQYAKVLQEAIVTMRDGRFVVPVRAEAKNELKGLLHDTSASGATVFIEPMAVVEANNDIRLLQNAEQQEIDRILLDFSVRVGEMANSLLRNFDSMMELDILFAKSRLADEMRAVVPEIRRDNVIRLNKARHPLIDKNKVVPVDISLGEDFDTLVITGPNTGGKTVVLKTLGLLCLMAACGLMLPAASSSCVPVFTSVLADIGDEQSIEQSLSTFSSHIKNIISILDLADENSLILTDELGAGTDPVEGAALAVSILEAFRAKGALMAATTHYAEIKMYALTTPGVENGSCEFDVETLSPTYRLLVGVPGRSNAFAISRRLGLPEVIIERAGELVSTENTRFEDVVDRLESSRQTLEKEREETERKLRQAEELRCRAQEEQRRSERESRQAIAKAREDAQAIVERVRSQTDLLLNELEELKKDKDKEDFSRRLSEMRGHYNSRIGKLRDLADPIAEAPQPEPDNSSRKPKSGDTVLIADLNVEGTVLSGPDSSGNYIIQAGILKSKINQKRLRLLDTSGKKVTFNGRSSPHSSSGKPQKIVRSASMELDIRGMAADEGIMEVNRFLDDAMMSNLHTVVIIHGKGTGVLRNAVQNHLRKLKCVKSFRPGVYGEGEAGVTVVELK